MHRVLLTVSNSQFGRQQPYQIWLDHRLWWRAVNYHHHQMMAPDHLVPNIKSHHSFYPARWIAAHTKSSIRMHHSLPKCFDIDTTPIRMQNTCRSIENIGGDGQKEFFLSLNIVYLSIYIHSFWMISSLMKPDEKGWFSSAITKKNYKRLIYIHIHFHRLNDW